MFCPVISLDGFIQVQQFGVIHLTTPRAADLSGLVGIFDDFMEKSKITKCHKFQWLLKYDLIFTIIYHYGPFPSGSKCILYTNFFELVLTLQIKFGFIFNVFECFLT